MHLIKTTNKAQLILTGMLILLLACLTAPLMALQQTGGTGDFSDSKLKTVAKAYIQVFDIQKLYGPQIEAAQNQQEAQQLQQQANEQMVQAIEHEEDLTVEEYSEVINAVQQSAELREKLNAFVEEIQEERAED